ncbi:MAG: hypothetical protein IPP94_07550 [Ignavibacteria bacterium]|nr:hypothetical protein [Ignavibacteria bacterium]
MRRLSLHSIVLCCVFLAALASCPAQPAAQGAIAAPSIDVRTSAEKALQTTFAIPATKAMYFPLAEGNYWEFRGNFGGYRETIVGSEKDSAGVTHYRFDRRGSIAGASFRWTPDNRLLLSKHGREQLWLDFDAQPGKSWNVDNPDENPGLPWKVTLQSTTDSVIVPAGSYTRTYRFSFEGGPDNCWEEWYAPMVGPVRLDFAGLALRLDSLTNFHLMMTSTGIEAPHVAETVVLLGISPNPVDAASTVHIAVRDTPAHARVAVHDAAGRRVALLFDAELAPGTHAIPFNAGGLPSGVYAVTLEAAGRTTMRSAVRMR